MQFVMICFSLPNLLPARDIRSRTGGDATYLDGVYPYSEICDPSDESFDVRDHESAARSLREGLKEMFTLQRLQIPASLHKCLATTNIIESPQSGVERRTRNVTRWRDADMAHRWVASAWVLTEKHFRRIDGHADLWALATILGREVVGQRTSKEKVA